MSRSINSVEQSGTRETGKTLIAIGRHELGGYLKLVTFEMNNLPEGRTIEKIEGDLSSVTVYLHGTIFVIGGNIAELWRRVSKINIISKICVRVADLQIARKWGHSATASLDEIFVCGGYFSGEINSCEALNPRTNVWRRLPNMGMSRMDFSLLFHQDSRLFAIGGWNYANILSSCEMLEIESRSAAWRPMASMRHARKGHGAVQFDDRVFVAGGFGIFSSEVFTPPPFGSTTEIGQWTCILPCMSRTFAWYSSLVVVSAMEIVNFTTIEGKNGFEGAVERFALNPTSLHESVEFEAWTWTPLPPVNHLLNGCAIGVYYII